MARKLFSDAECIDIIVHMCERLGFVLLDRNAFPWANEARSTFAIVEPRNGRPVFGLARIETMAKYLEFLSPRSKVSLEVCDRRLLLARMCLCKEFEVNCGKTNIELARSLAVLRFPNPFFDKWESVKICSCAEEAILLLDL